MKIKWFSLVRVIGLVTVLLYHFFAKSFPGGFIGVDVFFVFSGYLITSLFFIELEDSENFNLVNYYKRRFLRIFPPLVIMIVTTLPFTVLLPMDFRANLAKQVAAAIGFVTNKFEILSGASYEAQQTPQLYIHTWTLSLEFLFYLIWGAVLLAIVFLLKILGNKGKRLVSQVRFFVLILAVFMTIISILQLELTFNPDYLSRSYFDFITHAYPFFIGAITAVFVGIQISVKKQSYFKTYPMNYWWIKTLIPVIILVLLTLFGKFESVWTIRTNLILTSILTAILIVQFRILHEKTSVLEPKILTILADTSYSLYLFHWPIWLILSHLIPNIFFSGILSFIVSFAAAATVYYGVEPYFHGKKTTEWLRSKPFYGALGILSLVSFIVIFTAPKISNIERSLNESRISETMVNLDKKGQLVQNLLNTGTGIFTNSSWYYPQTGFSSSETLRLNQSVLKDVTAVSDKVLNSSQTVLGDSVMVGVVPYLSNILPDADIVAEIGQNLESIYQVFDEKTKSDKLGKYIIISAGVNVTDDMKGDVQKMIDAAPKGTHMVFVTQFDGKNATVMNDFNDYLKTLSNKYNWIVIADWASYIAPQADKLWDDQLHFGGKQAVSADYLNLIIRSLNEVAKAKGKT
ncbi:acyltransferase [Lactococcus hodotermopsidis]|uniref:Acyltransferase n=1 Tax=Pseudolactococcus hodotermopsidis TaxID=2709157 RepID=A0A6A0BE47_9LACT|nr:acyltransferase family protein [Lactococcus hodotermopsidis]GFH42631.1 acyltransferase [Lactococcus hodotermopsidis]